MRAAKQGWSDQQALYPRQHLPTAERRWPEVQERRYMRGNQHRSEMIGKRQRDHRLVRDRSGERCAHPGVQFLPYELEGMVRAARLRCKDSTGMVGASFHSPIHFHSAARCLAEQ